MQAKGNRVFTPSPQRHEHHVREKAPKWLRLQTSKKTPERPLPEMLAQLVITIAEEATLCSHQQVGSEDVDRGLLDKASKN